MMEANGTPSEYWQNRLCVVTGAASGIGLATTTLLNMYGAEVIAIDIDEKLLIARTSIMKGERKPIPIALDISDEEQIMSLFAEYKHRSLAGLFNIAGILQPSVDIEELSCKQWDRVMAVNVKSMFMLVKYGIPLFRNNKSGSVINVSSVHAFASMKNTTSYAASKGAVVALTTQLALELANRKIRVVGIAPGSVNTLMTTAGLTKGLGELDEIGIPTDGFSIGHLGEPEEIAEAIVWAASPNASFLNGTTLVLDGGMLARLF
jgi:NAD(P)-dependent dehydrogenase (short-subunit alcohol dehydrogenase family)